jgi:hypothetical protein
MNSNARSAGPAGVAGVAHPGAARHGRRLLTGLALAGLALVATGWLAGCSSTPDLTVHRKAEAPLAVNGLRIVFLERKFNFETTDPRFNEAYVDRTVQSLSKTFRQVLGDGLKAQGIESISVAAPFGSDDRELPPAVMVWLTREQPRWPVLFVIPNGASLHCAPCTMRTSMQLQLDDDAKILWSATFRQPAFTGSLTVGDEAAHEHFAREVMRELGRQLKGSGQPA